MITTTRPFASGRPDPTPAVLPFWQVNVPPFQRTAHCPEGLRGLSAKDEEIISTPDAEYTRQSWEQVKYFVATNQLELFRRVPSDLRRYRMFVHDLTRKYGSVMNFVLAERLGWTEDALVPKGAPFEFEEDYRVLFNDWPYGIDEKIVHLVVWTKFELEEMQDETGDMTPGARQQVENFVRKKFSGQVRGDQVRITASQQENIGG